MQHQITNTLVRASLFLACYTYSDLMLRNEVEECIHPVVDEREANGPYSPHACTMGTPEIQCLGHNLPYQGGS